ncbi:hypothetical protein ACVIYL_000219 [Bradyrhizobium sp. USDA 3315]
MSLIFDVVSEARLAGTTRSSFGNLLASNHAAIWLDPAPGRGGRSKLLMRVSNEERSSSPACGRPIKLAH